MDNFDNIPYRIDFIKKIFTNNKFNPLIDFNNNETDKFENSTNNIDTRLVLNKYYISTRLVRVLDQY